jgi:hypothetical protein
MQMSPSDWLTLVLSLGGVACGALTAFYFFRAQQQTDFKRIEVLLTKMSDRLSDIKAIEKIADHTTLVEGSKTVQSDLT